MTEPTNPDNKSAVTVANDLIGQDDTQPILPPEVEPVDLNSLKYLISVAGSNPAQLRFPQDKWGFTSQIKTAILKAASTVKGQDDKHDLLIATLAVLIAHIKARKESDKQTQAMVREHHQQAAAERGPRERVSAGVVNNQPVVIPVE